MIDNRPATPREIAGSLVLFALIAAIVFLLHHLEHVS